MTPEATTFPFRLICLEETDSTNNYLSALCDKEEVTEFTTVCANFQTAGKGQRGNSWESEAGKNLLFSFVVYPHFVKARDQFVLSEIISLSVKEALDCRIADVSVKWPNDIYWKDKKICGMLIENVLGDGGVARCIAGIGLNINQRTFFSDAPNPVSLAQITGMEVDMQAVLTDIMLFCSQYYESLKLHTEVFTSRLTERYNQSLYRREGIYPFRDAQGTFEASILRVAPDGRLFLLDTEGKERSYLFKEVQFII
ncbi:MAG: biotin--[acetyl-CoA-carboxylase] ligase [Bacteroidaceae bacterium]|nr:biotin--[acetyl-CoA-carboxylase] ligase [Bacteroidaceae bacterium]